MKNMKSYAYKSTQGESAEFYHEYYKNNVAALCQSQCCDRGDTYDGMMPLVKSGTEERYWTMVLKRF